MSAETALLQRAAEYLLSALDTVTPELLARPTPCPKWNVRMLLSHVCESVAALREGVDEGRVELFPARCDETDIDPAGVLRRHVTALRDERVAAADDRPIAVADQGIPQWVLAGVAALELTVHGWDVFQASGSDRPIPPELAAGLLAISPMLVPDGNRRPLFAPPVRTSGSASAGDELLAFLGRLPRSATQPPQLSSDSRNRPVESNRLTIE